MLKLSYFTANGLSGDKLVIYRKKWNESRLIVFAYYLLLLLFKVTRLFFPIQERIEREITRREALIGSLVTASPRHPTLGLRPGGTWQALRCP